MKTLNLFGALLAGLLLVSMPARAALFDFNETGDAGDQFHPEATVGDGTLAHIIGDIGGGDTMDVFAFKFIALGDGSVFGADVEGTGALIGLLDVALFDERGNVITDFTNGGARTPANMGTGIYEVGVLLPAVQIPDPMYTITFVFNPNIADIQALEAPEPASLGLMAGAIGALGWLRRRRRG